MTSEAVYDFMDMIVRFTIFGVYACFMTISIVQIWKWMIELMISFISCLFPGFEEPEEDGEDGTH